MTCKQTIKLDLADDWTSFWRQIVEYVWYSLSKCITSYPFAEYIILTKKVTMTTNTFLNHFYSQENNCMYMNITFFEEIHEIKTVKWIIGCELRSDGLNVFNKSMEKILKVFTEMLKLKIMFYWINTQNITIITKAFIHCLMEKRYHSYRKCGVQLSERD